MSSNDATSGCIRTSFKYYKGRKPPPSFDDVLDFQKPYNHDEMIPFDLQLPSLPAVAGLQPIEKWKAYQLKSMPGFVFITNPFLPGYQRYWIQRCLYSYPIKPNRTNLDIHMELTEDDNIWQIGQRDDINSKDNILQKLRWSNLGFPFDWNNQVYSQTSGKEFPNDLKCLTTYIGAALGYNGYNPEAAFINYYHLDSQLCAHNDHSEFDHEAPLISTSFGQTAIFLVGGLTKEERSVSMFLRSGDITVLMGPSRLNFHAVPRILEDDAEYVKQCLQFCTDSEQLNSEVKEEDDKSKSEEEFDVCKCNGLETKSVNELAHSNECSEKHITNTARKQVNCDIMKAMKDITKEDWTPYEEYLSVNRINMNARQVLKEGQDPPK